MYEGGAFRLVFSPQSAAVEGHFLVNGASYAPGQTAIAAGAVNGTVLLRFLSTSMELRMPLLQGGTMAVIAEGMVEKASFEVQAPATGVLRAPVPVDTPVVPGAQIAQIETEG